MIVVFGSINVDLIFSLDQLPAPGQTLLAHGLRIDPGGKGANQAVAAARDGAHVAMAGATGQDDLVETALSGLRGAEVDLSRVVVATDRPTGCASVCADATGRNQIAVAPGANLAALASQVEDAVLGRETILVTQMETDPAETAALILRARRLGARTLLNLAPAGDIADEALEAVDILVVNEDEAAWLGDRLGCVSSAHHLYRRLGGTVIRTLGGDGVEWATQGVQGHLPAPRVAVHDTTGAGDCFVGTLAAALDRGAGLDEAIARAVTAASLSCVRPGGQASLPWAPEIDAAGGTGAL